MEGNPLLRLKTVKWHQLVPFLASQTARPWPTSPASCVVIYSRLSACPGEMGSFEDHVRAHGCLANLKNMSQKKQSG